MKAILTIDESRDKRPVMAASGREMEYKRARWSYPTRPRHLRTLWTRGHGEPFWLGRIDLLRSIPGQTRSRSTQEQEEEPRPTQQQKIKTAATENTIEGSPEWTPRPIGEPGGLKICRGRATTGNTEHENWYYKTNVAFLIRIVSP